MPTYLNILLRAVLSYFILLLFTKIMGKREISQLTYFDYIVGITIGSISANMALNLNSDYIEMFPALIVFAALQIITSYLSMKNKSFRNVMEGSKTVLIEKGKVLEKNLSKERLNIDELMSMLREKNVFNLKDVEYAFLETSGKLSVMKKANKEPLTPNDINLEVNSSGIGHLIIEQGVINEKELRSLGLTKSWLSDTLNNQGYKDIKKIMYAQVDNQGKIYIDLYEDNKD